MNQLKQSQEYQICHDPKQIGIKRKYKSLYDMRNMISPCNNKEITKIQPQADNCPFNFSSYDSVTLFKEENHFN